MLGINNVYGIIWDFTEWFYQLTGLRCQTPVELFFPNFGPWLFGKMINQKGVPVAKHEDGPKK